jgi:anaerobic ribonucleoside-triphosphate reductase activating protein
VQLRVAAVADVTAAEGPHDRFALWVQGCSLRCPGCCNPEMFGPTGGRTVELGALLARVEKAKGEHGIEGITVLGGEPLEQIPAVAELCRGARELGLGTLVFTGLRLAQARRRPGFAKLWAAVDTLVDGPYVHAQAEPPRGRRYVGSRNQRILHRTLRYADPGLWSGSQRAQVEIDEHGHLTITGFPGPVQRLVAARAAW